MFYCPKGSLKIRIFKITREFTEIISCHCTHSVLAGKTTIITQASIQVSTAIFHFSKGSKSFIQLGEIGAIFDFKKMG